MSNKKGLCQQFEDSWDRKDATATAKEVSSGSNPTTVCVRMVFFPTGVSWLGYGMAQGKGECSLSGLARPAVWSANQMVLQTLSQPARWFYIHSLFSQLKTTIGGSCHKYYFSFGIFVVTSFVATNMCFLQQNTSFVMTKVCLP